jgi:hypothetical protein
MSVVESTSPSRTRISPAQLVCDDEHAEADLDVDVISLLEENARLRALVTQLSDLVLRHVVDLK